MKLLLTILGSFFYTGFFPFASATFATAVFLLIYEFIPGGEFLVHPMVVLATLVASVPISTYMEKTHGHDSGKIVIDEVVGIQVVLMFADPTRLGLVVAFFAFRFFDIIKPYPIGRSQKLPKGYGVVCDDVLAGIYTRVTMILIALLWPAIGRFI